MAGKPAPTARRQDGVALSFTVKVEPMVAVVRKHVYLTPEVAKSIEDDLLRLFSSSQQVKAIVARKSEAVAAPVDPVLSTQAAADLVGVSRPYLVARIDAGDIPLHQQIGNQRRVLKSAVLAWHRAEQARRRRALVQLGTALDGELFAD